MYQRGTHSVVVKSGWVAVAVGCECEALYESGQANTGWWLGGNVKRSIRQFSLDSSTKLSGTHAP